MKRLHVLQIVNYEGSSEDFSMSHLPFLGLHFPVGFGYGMISTNALDWISM